MTLKPTNIDVLCVGHACYDLIFSVDQHPQKDEKIFASNLKSSGGGPAANAAVLVARLGYDSAFSGYLGRDLYGDMHVHEFHSEHVNTQLLIRGASPTPLSTVLVKPDGARTLVNYKGSTTALSSHAINFSEIRPKTILLDGHELHISLDLIEWARERGIATILDAGSLHEGTSRLWNQVDYLVASEKFACQFSGDVDTALSVCSQQVPNVVITLGEHGLVWQKNKDTGSLPAYKVKSIDTTGAGDAFHGAFAVAISQKMDWDDSLLFASAAGALCCTQLGARTGLPDKVQLQQLLTRI